VVVSRLSLQRGFRIYRHSVGPTAKEFRLLLMCGHYQSIRCPFLLTYKKPDLPNAVFFLLRYRPEHNHPLSPAGAIASIDGNYEPQYNEM